MNDRVASTSLAAIDPELTSSSPNPKHYFVTPERTVVPAKGALLRQPADLIKKSRARIAGTESGLVLD